MNLKSLSVLAVAGITNRVLQYNRILRVSGSAAITQLARTQQRLPMVSPPPLKRLTPVRRFPDQ